MASKRNRPSGGYQAMAHSFRAVVLSCSLPPSLRAAHAVAAVVAQVAIAVADGDCAAIVATRGIQLELGELLAGGRVWPPLRSTFIAMPARSNWAVFDGLPLAFAAADRRLRRWLLSAVRRRRFLVAQLPPAGQPVLP